MGQSHNAFAANIKLSNSVIIIMHFATKLLVRGIITIIVINRFIEH